MNALPPDISAIVEERYGPDGPHARFDVDGRRVEYDAIVELLVRERTPGLDAAAAARVAGLIAAGCFGERHLWHDMGLSSREELRSILEAAFSPFAAGNSKDMRWKKYVYRRLCRWEGFHACRAPSCAECSSYVECFSPED